MAKTRASKHVVSSRRFDAQARVNRQRLRDRVLDKLIRQEKDTLQ